MKHVLIVSDSLAVRREVRSVLSAAEFTVAEVTSGEDVLGVVSDRSVVVPDLVVCDLQAGNRGGMAVTMDLRLEESGGRLPRVGVLLLLDRRPDVFLARRSEADGFIVKPLDPLRLRRAVAAVLAGEGYEDDSYRPASSLASPASPAAPAASAAAAEPAEPTPAG